MFVKYALAVHMEDGTQYTVDADQRDVAKWEMQPFGTSGNAMGERIHLAMRFMAWSALRRMGTMKLAWDEFSEQCVEVVDAKGTGDIEAETPDPTQKARSEES